VGSEQVPELDLEKVRLFVVYLNIGKADHKKNIFPAYGDYLIVLKELLRHPTGC